MKYLPLFFCFLIFSCSNKATKEEAYNYFIAVSDVYENDCKTNLEWIDELKTVLTSMQTDSIPDSSAVSSVLEKFKLGVESHHASLEKLNKIKPIASDVNLLLTAKESTSKKIKTQQNITRVIEIFYDGITPEENEDFKLYQSTLKSEVENIALWRRDTDSFKKEFNFTKEERQQIDERYNL